MHWLSLRKLFQSRQPPLPLGRRGEAAAAHYLQRLGYRLVARGHRDRIGELDLVAVDGRTVVFVEVKTRRSHNAGSPQEAVQETKQRQLTRAALSFLRHHDLLEEQARFDVVAVTWPSDAAKPSVEHFMHAFQAIGRWQLFS